MHELKVQGAEAILTALFESHTEGFSLGRVVERFRELADIPKGAVEGLYERIQVAGGLTVNNALQPEEMDTPVKGQ